MNQKFPGLELEPPLFYNWDVAIRFELGVDYRKTDGENSVYINNVYIRAITLFKTLHLPEDEIFMVVNVNDFGNRKVFSHRLKVFSKYIKEKHVLYKLQQVTIPYGFPEDVEEEKYKTHRFSLKCKTSDIKYISLLKAICNHDMGFKPSISYDVFFINTTKETIFRVYDDRGSDLLASSPDKISHIYEQYNGWILDYDRELIDEVFK
ncbi:DUF3885 domain-containing protein [Salinicoccus sesuvii]